MVSVDRRADGGAVTENIARPETSGNDAPRPRAVVFAIRTMWIGAGLSLLAFAVEMLQRDTIRQAVERQAEVTGIGPDKADMIFYTVVGVAVVTGPIGAVLWVWMAVMNARGRNWARVLGTVFLFFGAVALLWLYQEYKGHIVGLALQTAVMVAGLVATLLTWHTESNPHYARRIDRSAEH